MGYVVDCMVLAALHQDACSHFERRSALYTMFLQQDNSTDYAIAITPFCLPHCADYGMDHSKNKRCSACKSVSHYIKHF